MVFNSFTYALFLAVCLGFYFVLPLRGRQAFLLLASYVFYCWEKPVYGILLVLSTLLDDGVGLLMTRIAAPGRRKLVLALSICGNLGMLGYFKYGDFLGANLAGLGSWLGFAAHWTPMGIVLPVGISFYTFQTMSYAIQVYRRQIPATRDLLAFALYVSYFPQLVAGPIERASHLLPQLLAYQRPTLQDWTYGLTRIAFGLFRKLVLADRFAIIVDPVFRDPLHFSSVTVLTAVLAFGGQIYFDFAGYCDIAVGSARLMGVRLTENFRRPFAASSIADFWTRWHLTLTGWLRDYLFAPLGGFRKGGARALLNATFVLALCGLWHGASWHFVLWGLYHAGLMNLYYLRRAWLRRGGRRAPPQKTGLVLLLSTVFTYLCTSMSCVFFRAPDVPTVGHVFQAMAGFQGAVAATPWIAWAYLGLIALTVAVEMLQEYGGLNQRIARWPLPARALGLGLVIVLTLLLAVNNNTPYLYFQF